jgi:hypothetical protein
MAFRSRWGWHPCDYETYLLLKKLHGLYQQALRRYAAWQRWQRKRPHNRVLRRRIRDARGRTIGKEVIGPWPEPPLPGPFCVRRRVLTQRDPDGRPLKDPRLVEEVIFDDLGVGEGYRAARRPAPTEAEVKPLRLTAEAIRHLLSLALAET